MYKKHTHGMHKDTLYKQMKNKIIVNFTCFQSANPKIQSLPDPTTETNTMGSAGKCQVAKGSNERTTIRHELNLPLEVKSDYKDVQRTVIHKTQAIHKEGTRSPRTPTAAERRGSRRRK